MPSAFRLLVARLPPSLATSPLFLARPRAIAIPSQAPPTTPASNPTGPATNSATRPDVIGSCVFPELSSANRATPAKKPITAPTTPPRIFILRVYSEGSPQRPHVAACHLAARDGVRLSREGDRFRKTDRAIALASTAL